ncbi:MAG: hypothetical protein JSW11_08575 [Candidatus Heimdallarchaeota archaeon]|nr:MAG: hypothetical protein JSW11_08575 [Candidatus Heimdallarchaeota archaeon]
MRTSTITVRLPLKVLHDIERLSEVTKLRPSVLCAYVLQDKLHEWAHEYAENISKEIIGDRK